MAGSGRVSWLSQFAHPKTSGARQDSSMHTIRFIMVGGFLGAGKTTTLGRLVSLTDISKPL